MSIIWEIEVAESTFGGIWVTLANLRTVSKNSERYRVGWLIYR